MNGVAFLIVFFLFLFALLCPCCVIEGQKRRLLRNSFSGEILSSFVFIRGIFILSKCHVVLILRLSTWKVAVGLRKDAIMDGEIRELGTF